MALINKSDATWSGGKPRMRWRGEFICVAMNRAGHNLTSKGGRPHLNNKRVNVTHRQTPHPCERALPSCKKSPVAFGVKKVDAYDSEPFGLPVDCTTTSMNMGSSCFWWERKK